MGLYSIIKSATFRLQRSAANHAVLEQIAERCDKLWNAANYICRQRFIRKDKVPGYSELCRIVPKQYPQDYGAVPSDMAQEVLKKLSEAWSSFFQLLARFASKTLPHRPGLVRYRKSKTGQYPKDFIVVKCARSYGLHRESLSLPLPADLRKQGRLVAPIRGNKRYSGKPGRLELVYDKADRLWRATVSIDTAARQFRPAGRAAGIDLGLRIAASLTIEGQSHAHHFRGRELLKEFQYWTRQIAQHQKELSSRKLFSSRRLLQLYATRGRWQEHALQAIARAIAGLCRSSGVMIVYIGWPKGIRDDVKTCKDWRGRIHSYWAFYRFATILLSALERVGITGIRVGERGTSSTCPWTLDPAHRMVRRPRWKLRCRDCDRSMHSDAAGSGTILAFNTKTPGIIRDAVKATATPRTHAWNKHAWVLRENRSSPSELLAA